MNGDEYTLADNVISVRNLETATVELAKRIDERLDSHTEAIRLVIKSQAMMIDKLDQMEQRIEMLEQWTKT